MDLLLYGFIFSVSANILMFIPAFIFRTDKLTDISYALTFIFVAIFGYYSSDREPLHYLLLAMVCLWAVRLGGFLFIRIQKMKRDKRFDGMRENFGKFLRFWLLQGISVAIILTAAMLAWSEGTTITSLSIAGSVIFALGLMIEHTADMQKYKFNHSNKTGKWIDTGIWRMSRHPNYLGEILVWTGIYLAVFSSLSTSYRVVGLISPLFISILLLFVSGIPLLEKSADKKWGKDKDYQNYKKEVPVIIPTPKSIQRIFN